MYVKLRQRCKRGLPGRTGNKECCVNLQAIIGLLYLSAVRPNKENMADTHVLLMLNDAMIVYHLPGHLTYKLAQ